MDNRKPSSSLQRATSYDVARLAGVSQSAVSRCFKPGASVSKKMRDKVMAAAKELRYQPNAIARSLITRRSNLIAVMISSQINFYYPEVLMQLTERFARKGLRVLPFTLNEEQDVAASLDQMWRYQVDGVISASYLSIDEHKAFEDRQIPVVLFNRYFSEYETNSVWCDPTQAVEDMVQHLNDFGHQRFALLEGPEYSMVSSVRMDAFRKALKNRGLSITGAARGNYRYESAAEAVQTLMAGEKADRPTAIICANDMMAIGAMDELRVMGRDVPGDVSVTGFDGIASARFASYELTTIVQPIDRMADAAVTMLVDQISDPELTLEKHVLTGAFLRGSSTGPAQ